MLRLAERKHLVATMVAPLGLLSPQSTLGRGYSITMDACGKVLRDISQVKVGDELQTRLANGELKSRVEGKHRI